MKAKILMGGALAALVLGMTACAIDEVVQTNPIMEETETIAFKATLGHSTRATAVTSNDLKEFSVWGWNANGLFMSHETFYADGAYYESDSLYLWPSIGANFAALIPVVGEEANTEGTSVYLGGEAEAGDVAASDKYYTGHFAQATIGADGGAMEIMVDTPSDNADQLDLCYAVAMDNPSGSYVTLNFRHALSQVVFKAVNNNVDITVDVAGVSLHSISKTGLYTLPSTTTTPHLEAGTSTSTASGTQGTWAVGEPYNDSKFTAEMAQSKTLTSEREPLLGDDGALFLIPQTTGKWDVENDAKQSNGGAYFLVNCRIEEHGSQLWPEKVGEFGEVAMPVDIDWEEGYRYTYTFIFGAGAGYYPPTDDNKPGEPIFNLINFEVTVDEFQNAAGVDVSTEVDDSDGSLDNPYPVSTALKLIGVGKNTADTVYVKGVISEISEVSPLAAVTAGHATYYIADAIPDTGGVEEQIMVFDGLSLGGVEFASNDEIAVGDEVIVYGVLAADEDETPEITESIIYSLNGETYEEPEEEPEPEEGELIYGNDFDKEAATSTYGSGSSWPYLDQFDGWQNEEGSGIESVSYKYNNVSVRSNSNSNGSYSNYDGSGTNNIFFGSTTNYFVIQNITLPSDATDYTLTFGSEKYLSGGSSVFSHEEFHVYLSNDGLKWVALSFAFPDGDPDATWDEANTTFTLPSGTESLYIYFTADVASAYRIDDVKLMTTSEVGTVIDFSTGIELDGGDQEPEEHVMVGDGTEDSPYTASDAIALIENDSSYDKSVYITGIVSQIGELYSSYNELSYYLSDDGTTTNQLYVFEGYGLNGEKIYSTDYLKLGDELVIYGELKAYNGSAEVNYGSKMISINGETGVDEGDIVDATAAEVNSGVDGTTYRVAGYITSVANTTYGNFYLKDYTGQTYIYGTLDANGNTKNWESLGISAGDIVTVHGPKSTYGSTAELTDVTVDEHYPVTDVTIAEFNAASVSTEVYYRLTGTVTSIANSSYGNLTIEDETGSVYVYGLPCGYGGADSTFPDTGVAQGDKITIVGTRGVYNSTIEVVNGFYVETVSSGSSGDTGDDDDLVYGNDFDKSVVSGNTTITNSVTAYQNETGSGASGVSYNWSSKMSVRKSNSSDTYANASGGNNIFFGTDDPDYFVIKNIALPSGETNYKLTFGAREDGNVFATSTFKLYVSQDNAAWVQLAYDFPDGNTKSSSWALASTTFTVPSGTSTLYLYYEGDVESVYRIDDVRLTVSDEAGTAIDFSTGVELEGGDSTGSGGDTGGDTGESGDTGGNEDKYYVKVTEELSDWTGTYLIVNESATAAFDGSSSALNSAGNYKTVTISDGKIAYDSTSSSCQFTIEPYGDGYSIKGATNYIYHTGSSNTINFGTTAQANLISYDSSNSCAVIQEPDSEFVLRFNTTWIGFRYYKGTQSPVQLYKLED